MICIIATFFWATTAVLIRYLTDSYQIPPLVLAFWRDLFLSLGLAILFALVKSKRLKLERRHWRFMIAYGFVLAIFNGLWTTSVVLNGAAISTVLAYGSAAYTAILGWRLFGESLNRFKMLAVTLSLLGCVFVSGAYDISMWRLNSAGLITGLISGFTFAAYNLMGKAATQRGINPWTTLVYVFGLAVPFLLFFNLLPLGLPEGMSSTNLLWLGEEWFGWAMLFMLAIGPTVVGYGLFLVSLTSLPASVANLIATLEPAITAILAYLFLGEVFTLPQWIGSVLIVSGVILIRFSEARNV
jgi:drug/metabolite transporter (DMT)-like permease